MPIGIPPGVTTVPSPRSPTAASRTPRHRPPASSTSWTAESSCSLSGSRPAPSSSVIGAGSPDSRRSAWLSPQGRSSAASIHFQPSTAVVSVSASAWIFSVTSRSSRAGSSSQPPSHRPERDHAASSHPRLHRHQHPQRSRAGRKP